MAGGCYFFTVNLLERQRTLLTGHGHTAERRHPLYKLPNTPTAFITWPEAAALPITEAARPRTAVIFSLTD